MLLSTARRVERICNPSFPTLKPSKNKTLLGFLLPLTFFDQKRGGNGKMCANCVQIFDSGNAIIVTKMATLKLALDTRRVKKDGAFPLVFKLSVNR